MSFQWLKRYMPRSLYGRAALILILPVVTVQLVVSVVFIKRHFEGVTEQMTHVTALELRLILTDINMPIMDGLKLVSMVRNDPNYKETPIIVITTEGAIEDRERALALGANEYITKPIQTMKILETVKKLMSV